jgi:hypothetical protein
VTLGSEWIAANEDTGSADADLLEDQAVDEALVPTCRRCERPVVLSYDQYEVFEQMHYVCFHYEFEHDPVDPDEECYAGGCPSATVNPRPERRPGGGL